MALNRNLQCKISKVKPKTKHSRSLEKSNSSANDKPSDSSNSNNKNDKKPHIKKPLNAFMLYMKEMRAKVVAECTLKESAAINQILGRRVSEIDFICLIIYRLCFCC